MTNDFALIGAAGYVAPRHLRAIKELGCNLTVAFDPRDSVGVLDSYFPDARFFVEFERFDRHVDKLRRRGQKIDYVSICSPNHLHDAHCRFALRSDAHAICEKPLVLNPWNVDGLEEVERETGRRISTIMQLRLHPSIRQLKERIAKSPERRFAVDLSYITSRGRWYHISWKGDETKSGGIVTNIGIHFFDMLLDIFGPAEMSAVHLRDSQRAAGFLSCKRADVRWFLSIDRRDLPEGLPEGASTFRSITVDGNAVEFSEGFVDLHRRSYEEILAGRGFDLSSVRPSIELVASLRDLPIRPGEGERHAMVQRHMS